MIHAVLAGINNYPDAPLRFCINDINDVSHYLKLNGGLKDENVVLLVDAHADKAAILSVLKEKVASLQSGDILYFHYSGHGSQVPNRGDAWESDGLDEVLCPYFTEWSADAFIKDDELFDIFSKKPADAFIVFMADCCHSGDIGRSVKIDRGLSKNLQIPEWLKNIFTTKAPEEKLKVYNYTLPNVVVLSACDSKQTAMDGGAGIKNGRFTHALLTSLLEKPAQTFEQLIVDLQVRCKYVQTPQLQCAKILRKRTFLKPKAVRSRAKKIKI